LRKSYLEKYDLAVVKAPSLLVLPEEVTEDEFIEELAEHRIRSKEAMRKFREEEEDRFKEDESGNSAG
jgi:hypothetical protein